MRPPPRFQLALLGVLPAAVGCARPPAPGTEAAPSAAPSVSAAVVPPAHASAPPQRTPPVAHVPSAPPPEDAPLALLRAFVTAHPDHPAAERLRSVHDRRLLPCPHERRYCEPATLILAQGALDRAAAYPTACLACRDRAAITQLQVRLAGIVRDLETREAREAFERALIHDVVAAEQIVADAVDAYPTWRQRAAARIASRRAKLGLATRPLDETCRVPASYAAVVSPAVAVAPAAVRVVLTTRSAPQGATLTLEQASGAQLAWDVRSATDEGAPAWWLGTAPALATGEYRAVLRAGGEVVACQRLQVATTAHDAHEPATSGAWPSERGWTGAQEDLYAAWLRILTEAPEAKHWHGLFELTRDPARNVLFDHLGLGEDSGAGLVAAHLEPDCADGPYFLRAYFAWKLGLPFGWHECRYGETGPPTCKNFATNSSWEPTTPADAAEHEPAGPAARLARMGAFLNDLKEEVMARSLRTSLTDDVTDLYPVSLTREGLRPGVVFADPYGHTLTLVRWIPQRDTRPGQLLSVDAQPDGTLAIKRFWRGNFLFADRHGLGGHGFKAFRPLVLDAGEARPLTSPELLVARGYGEPSLEQRGLAPAEFYARVQRLINPDPLDPVTEYRALHEALQKQLVSRVQSIDVAEEHRRDSGGKSIEMPAGRGIFHTAGPWEAYSTPCRDLRLLVGIDRLLEFPAEAATGEAGGPRDTALEARLTALHHSWASELTFEYTRSDGSRQRLSLADVVARRRDLELAYNPNDCPEVRWAAPTASAELATCARRAPTEQQRRMVAFRHWFEKRYACG